MSEIDRFVPLQELSVIDVGVRTAKFTALSLSLPNNHRHRAKLSSPSPCKVAAVVNMRSRRCRHRAKSSPHGRVLFLCSSSASIIVALCYLRCRNTWSPSLCRPHRPSLICFLHLKELSVIDVGVRTAKLIQVIKLS
ncbi:hypothetical protein DEO72_LG2g3117 [Vigna unguiculata]|uniref:Uncharacterized protein n=1 Tax=Vigna unguiculata TaxID=3917 RepID=A0A4D6L2S9_VIGUN|nr:hypothetical protein DEO72_LG2g3117 [Vigna unguiculata]